MRESLLKTPFSCLSLKRTILWSHGLGLYLTKRTSFRLFSSINTTASQSAPIVNSPQGSDSGLGSGDFITTPEEPTFLLYPLCWSVSSIILMVWKARTLQIQVWRRTYCVASIDDLIAIKQKLGHLQDLFDLGWTVVFAGSGNRFSKAGNLSGASNGTLYLLSLICLHCQVKFTFSPIPLSFAVLKPQHNEDCLCPKFALRWHNKSIKD